MHGRSMQRLRKKTASRADVRSEHNVDSGGRFITANDVSGLAPGQDD
jgi:hypothetical protein